jgi:NADH dehydrogenase
MILVTGGTGFVGREVVGELLALDSHVRLLVRNPGKLPAFPHEAHHTRVELVQGDALKPETLPAAMVGVQVVIHLIGIITENAHATYEQAHTEATRNLLAAARQAGVTRWIQMSAIGTRPHARSRYHRSKWHAEELVRQSGLDWTIFRPSLIYGYDEHDRLLHMLRLVLSFPLDLLQAYSFPLIDGGAPLIQPVSVREVARCFAHAPAKEAAIGRTYDLVGPVPFKWREMIFKFLTALGKKGLYEEVPLLLLIRGLLGLALVLFPLLVLAMVMSGHIHVVAALVGAGVWASFILIAFKWRLASEALNDFAPRAFRPSEVLKMAVEDNVGDPEPAAKTFEYVPETFEQGLARIIK